MKKHIFILLFLFYSSSQFARQTIHRNTGNEQNGYLAGKYSTEGKVSISASSSETTFISLDGSWKFKQGEYVQGEQLTDSVMLPGTMDTNQKGNPSQVSPDNVRELTRHLSRYYTYAGNAVYENLDFQKASGQWAGILYREEIESALRSSHFAGYQLLSFQDFPGQATALVGFYDSFMDSKNIIKPEEALRFNSDIVLLAEMEKFIWTSDESYSAKIKIANYSPKALSAVIPFWLIKNENGGTLASGNFGSLNIQQGGLTALGEIDAPLKMITSSQKLTLEIGLTDSLYLNSYFIWTYPAKINTSVPSGIHITRILDQVAKNILASGGKVLLLPKPESMDSARSISPKFLVDFWSPMFHNYNDKNSRRKKGDSYTLGLLMNPSHPALKGFPTDFHSNWQWYDLVKNSRSIILDNTLGSYRPIVQTIDHFDRNLKLGNIFEAVVSGGKLLVCTFDLLGLLDLRPEARQLYNSLLTYMSSDTFQPSETFSERFFDDLIVNNQ